MRVEAIRTKDGYLIPCVGGLKGLRRKKVMLDVEVAPLESDYKELAAEAAYERYLERQKGEVPCRLTDQELDRISREFNLTAETVEDLLELQ